MLRRVTLNTDRGRLIGNIPSFWQAYHSITNKHHSCLGQLLKMLTRRTDDVLNLLIFATSNDINSIVINQSALITANEPRVSLYGTEQ